MKINHLPTLLCFCLLPSVFCLSASAQGTAFTYQGRLNDGTNPATGLYDLRFTLYDSTNLPGTVVAGPITNAATGVTNGLFTVMLDFGGSPFNGADRWLEIAVRGNSPAAFAPLAPRQQLTPAPYALSAANLMSLIDAPLEITVNGERVVRFEPTLTSPNIVGGYRSNSVVAGADAAVIAGGGREGAENYAGAELTFIGGGWANTNSGGGAFLGGGFLNRIETESYDSVVAGGRENVIQSNAVWSAIGGGLQNVIAMGATYSTIGGGIRNLASGNYSTIAGGSANTNAGFVATIGGGDFNLIQPTSDRATISGGVGNTIEDFSPNASIGGGGFNHIGTNSISARISGGYGHLIGDNTWDGTIGGGSFSTIFSNAFYATIGGGQYNTVGANEATVAGGRFNSALGFSSTVGGGGGNFSGGDYDVVAGGLGNSISSSAFYTTIGGGWSNSVGTGFSFVGSGFGNTLQPFARYSVLAGGETNVILTGAEHSVIGGGSGNTNSAVYATVPGGFANYAGGQYSFAAGRQAKAANNGAYVWADSTPADFASTANDQFSVRANGGVRFVTGGAGLQLDGVPVLAGAIAASNVNAASFSNTFWKVDGNAGTTAGTHFLGTTDNQPLVLAVNGARAFRLESGNSGSAPNVNGGSLANYIAPGLGSVTIAGGGQLELSNSVSANAATICGGRANSILPNAFLSTVSGGDYNTIQTGASRSVIAGGTTNTVGPSANWAVIGGGQGNTASGNGATVPGGVNNTAGSDYSFAAGRRAKATSNGSFVWADSQNADFATTAANQFLIRAANGVGINTSNTFQALTVGPAETPLNTGSQIGVYDSVQAFVVTRQTSANVEATFGADGSRGVLAVLSDHPLVFRAGNGSGGGNVEYMRINTNGFVGIGLTNPTNKLHVAGGVSATAFVSTSDRNAKEHFQPVSPCEVLAKVAALPISTWNFKDLHDGRHMGPMAQDFYAAFGLGGSDKTITTVDPDGVALAAIQGLNQKLEDQARVIAAKNAEISDLEQRLSRLEKMISFSAKNR